jgi:hypothetical protein
MDDGRTTDGRRTKSDHKSSPCHFVTGELIIRQAQGQNVKPALFNSNLNLWSSDQGGRWYIGQMCTTQPPLTPGKILTLHHFRLPWPLTSYMVQCLTKSHDVPKKLNSCYLKIPACTKKLWHWQTRMHPCTHKHWTAIMTTMSSSAEAGLTKIFRTLSIILQSISKIQWGQTNFNIFILPWHSFSARYFNSPWRTFVLGYINF